MTAPPLPAGLVRSLTLLAGVATTIALVGPMLLSHVAASDAASVALLVGGSGVIAWAAAQVSLDRRLAPAGAFAAGMTLPVSALLLASRRPRAANDNDHAFSGSLPQFISE